MGEKIVIGPVGKGFRNDVPPFYIDNDSFPQLINAYQWRARVKRKRGTTPICRLQRFFYSPYNSTTSFNLVGGAGNLLTGFGLEPTGNIIPGTVQFSDSITSNVYTDANEDGTLQGSPGGSGTINYSTGSITIVGGGNNNISSAKFSYYPGLPVMGLEDLNLNASQFPQTLAFDQTYSYQIINSDPYYSYDVSFYKNPAANAGTLPGYVPKTIPSEIFWNGQNYQQFWTTNYENALWATNGIEQPFSTTNIGMQFKIITGVSITSAGPPATAILTIASSGLVIGDFVFINEVGGIGGINLQTGYVTAVSGSMVTVEFPNATLTGSYTSGGIAQYLTSNVAYPTKDCIRVYDGSPVTGSQFSPAFVKGAGWVNFCPPIFSAPPEVTPDDVPSFIYYLVGARMIVPFKDRILFLGPVIENSIGSIYYLQDTIIFSENGTPYYTCSFTGNATDPETVFNPILTPPNQGAVPFSFFGDIAGFGGYITAGFAQPMTTVGANQDVLIVGFTNRQTKVVFTGNDLTPFNFYIINSELGATATFGSIIMDRGLLTIGDRGITTTDQQSCQRIDLAIPDYIFEIDLLNNGTQRITAQRDFINEWVYFSYPYNNEENITSPFPNQTLFYNYRSGSWAVFNESYTTYGQFRRQTGFTWLTVGQYFPTWLAWNEPWNASGGALVQQEVIAGNQQGFVVCREDATTSECPSLAITAISGVTVTSPNHGLNSGDFVYFLGAIGMTNFNSFPQLTASITGATNANPCVITSNNNFVVGDVVTITNVNGMIQLNGNSYTVTAATSTTFTIDVNSAAFSAYVSGGTASTASNYIIWVITVVDENTFTIQSNPEIIPPIIPSGTYLGNGTVTRLYIPQIQSKQFPTAWGLGRKTRLGVQQYLFTTTPNAQITLNIYLSQNSGNPFNAAKYVPSIEAQNNSVIYSNILYTCQESTNLGLSPANVTPANINLQQIVPSQAQTWHRMNTSLIGDTVQFGFTLSSDQMFDTNLTNQVAEIECHGVIVDVTPSQVLA